MLKVWRRVQGRTQITEHHIGSGVPYQGLMVEDVISVQASGTELELIYAQISGLPVIRNDNNVVCYWGDHAKLVASNVKL